MKRGFTLVEISIVLLIIGIIAGGILMGAGMLRSSKVQGQAAQFRQYDVAASNFKSAKQQIPGDCSDCASGDGNNDGLLGGNGIINMPVPPSHMLPEAYYYFPNLSEEGFIEEKYIASPPQFFIGEGKQFPQAAMGKGGIAVSGTAEGVFYLFIYKDMTLNDGGAIADIIAEGTMTTEEAFALDKKIDDGLPWSGSIIALKPEASGLWYNLGPVFQANNDGGCVRSDITYNLGSSAKCSLSVRANIE